MNDPRSPNPAENDEEMLDLLDPDGNVVGRARRGDVHGNPALRHVNPEGEYYLQKRSRLKRVAPGLWDTSVGGHVPTGESYEEGALRELAEELGILLPDASALERHHDWVWSTGFETEHTRTYLLRWEGAVRPDPVEVEEGRFWTPEDLRAAVGKGVLTDNLEKELEHLGLFP